MLIKPPEGHQTWRIHSALEIISNVDIFNSLMYKLAHAVLPLRGYICVGGDHIEKLLNDRRERHMTLIRGYTSVRDSDDRYFIILDFVYNR